MWSWSGKRRLHKIVETIGTWKFKRLRSKEIQAVSVDISVTSRSTKGCWHVFLPQAIIANIYASGALISLFKSQSNAGSNDSWTVYTQAILFDTTGINLLLVSRSSRILVSFRFSISSQHHFPIVYPLWNRISLGHFRLRDFLQDIFMRQKASQWLTHQTRSWHVVRIPCPALVRADLVSSTDPKFDSCQEVTFELLLKPGHP